ncbi:urea ABC transporter permease subunit UrtC [Belnapia moabensis]
MTLRLVLIGAVLVLAMLPALNRLPADSALHVSDFIVTVTGKWITYAILALAIDLAWGYAGILSLGHGAFFALGGYAIGMHLMRLIGPRGVYGHPTLPDFMVFLGYQELPWYWLGFDHFPFAILMAVAVPGLLAGVVGYLAFRSRITGVYLSIITQALTYALMLAFFRNDMGFGGNNGFTDFKELLGMPLNTQAARSALFYASLLLLLGALWLCSSITKSKLGRVLVAIRDAESRVRFLGYDVTQHKLFVFVLSAMIAGLAGALYVPQVGIINPGEFSPGNSIEAVIWVAVGGRGTLVGALLGAFSVNALKTWLTTVAPGLWLFALGGLFVAVTLFLPRGLIGLFSKAPK